MEYLAESAKILNVMTGLRIVNPGQVNLLSKKKQVLDTLMQNSSYNSKKKGEGMGAIVLFRHFTE